jgi:signal transduction histidine kinase
MAKLVEESKRTSAVVRRLRDFFRTGATRLERVAIADIAERVVASLRGRAGLAQVTLACDIPAGPDALQPLLADAVQIEVVLRNLLINALESAAATGARQQGSGGTVTLSVTVNKADMQLIEVRDSGSGIPAQEAERMFDSFVTTKSSGMGMGLAISRAIIEAHGGERWAIPGASGVLCFTLPQDAPSGKIA